MKDKFRAIVRVLRTKNFTLITSKHDTHEAMVHTEDLTDSILMAVEVQRTFNSMVKGIEELAKEDGEAHVLQSLAEVLKQVQDGKA